MKGIKPHQWRDVRPRPSYITIGSEDTFDIVSPSYCVLVRDGDFIGYFEVTKKDDETLDMIWMPPRASWWMRLLRWLHIFKTPPAPTAGQGDVLIQMGELHKEGESMP